MTTLLIESPFFPILFLLGSLLLTSTASALLQLGKFKSKDLLRSPEGPYLFFLPLLKKFFRQNEWENLSLCISISKHICELAYGTSAFFYLIAILPSLHQILVDIP